MRFHFEYLETWQVFKVGVRFLLVASLKIIIYVNKNIFLYLFVLEHLVSVASVSGKTDIPSNQIVTT